MGIRMSLCFWCNTVLEGLVPGGVGYRRILKKYRDRGYDHERDKSKVRQKHFGEEGWKKEFENGELKYRNYASYEEYLEHQKAKFDEIIRIHGGFDAKTTIKYRLNFYDRFRKLPQYLPRDAKILCAGARQGTEVQVLRELGFSHAQGIDLNPGPNNPYVKEGDFLRLAEPDSSLDLIYSNAVDHAFNLDDLFREHARAIKPSGFAYYDIAMQNGGVFEAVHWNSEEAVFQVMLKHFASVEMVKVDRGRSWKSVLLKGKRT
jgi:hypothetical protein